MVATSGGDMSTLIVGRKKRMAKLSVVSNKPEWNDIIRRFRLS